MDDTCFETGMLIDGIRHLTVKQSYQCYLKGAVIIDVREDFEIAVKNFDLSGIISCPYSTFLNFHHTLPIDKPLILVDCVGIHSKEAVKMLLGSGYTNIANMIGGIVDWEQAGLPMLESNENLSGQCPCTMRSRTKAE